MPITTSEHFNLRATAERQLANGKTDVVAAAAHTEIAVRCEELALELDIRDRAAARVSSPSDLLEVPPLKRSSFGTLV
ncbi:MAG: hypothetical protein ABIW03_01440 [Sphingomicrobium sp.]